MLNHLWLIPALPLLGFLLNGLFGKRLGNGFVSLVGPLSSFLSAVAGTVAVLQYHHQYPNGDRYVDVVGNDIYDIGFRPQWAANERLYRAHPSKPYAFPEWGLWGIDDPAFIRSMAKFVRTHRRVELLSWFNGQASGGTFDIATKPRSRAAYRAVITALER